MDKRYAKNYGVVTKGQYCLGREGYFTEPNQIDVVAFYPIEGKNPYRINLKRENITFIKREE